MLMVIPALSEGKRIADIKKKKRKKIRKKSIIWESVESV